MAAIVRRLAPRPISLPQFETTPPPPAAAVESREARRARRRAAKQAANAAAVDEAAKLWAPRTDPTATRDAYRTLFVGRLAFETTERRLERELAAFGTVAALRIVHDRSGVSRGYGFVQYANEEGEGWRARGGGGGVWKATSCFTPASLSCGSRGLCTLLLSGRCPLLLSCRRCYWRASSRPPRCHQRPSLASIHPTSLPQT